MNNFAIKLIYFTIITIHFQSYSAQTYKDECERNIYARCNHQSEFTKKELETARLYIQNMMRQAIYKPTQTPCKKIFVRKDYKCLTERERNEFIRVIRILYSRGVIDRLTDIHQRYWPALHKTSEIGPWHRWISHQLEKEMRKISPDITLPYYFAQLDAAHPEKSIVWQTLGTTGNHYTGYCVKDGLYSDLNTTRCIKREWNTNGTIPAIDGPEINTVWLQLSNTFVKSNFLLSGIHFLTHLAFGGYMGDMSVDTAPFDITFFLWHNYVTDILWLKQQLQSPEQVTQSDYGVVGRIDQATGKWFPGNLATDKMTYYGVPVADAHHLGFGELCSVTDQVIIAINQKVRNETVVPLAVKRLPLAMRKEYFPHSFNNKFDGFTHVFEEVGDCNKRCRPIPHFQLYGETENGRRLLRREAYDENRRVDWALVLSQTFHTKLINDLNKSGYCSPYVT